MCIAALFTVWVLVSKINNAESEYMTQVVCFGETLKLICNFGSTLEIYDAVYELLEKTSQYCTHGTKTRHGCDKSQMTKKLQNICGGKGECSLGYGVKDTANTINCEASMYLKVSYGCAVNRIYNTDGNEDVRTNPAVKTDLATTTISIDSSDKLKNMTETVINVDDGSLYFTLLRLFVQFRVAGEYMSDHSLWLVLCVVSSFAVGILLLIIYALLFKCYTKYRIYKKLQHQDEGPRHIEIIAPVVLPSNRDNSGKMLITRHNDTPYSDTVIASNSVILTSAKSSKDERNHQLISTIRRSHSVDEQTQTTSDTQAATNTSRALSPTEMQELGYLVADLKVYESQIEDTLRMDNPCTSKTLHRDGYDSPCISKTPHREEYDNVQNFFFSSDPNTDNSTFHTKNKSLRQENYLSPFPTSHCRIVDNNSINDRAKYNTRPSHTQSLSRHPSEISYETSTSNNSGDDNLKESIFFGDAFRLTSMQRNHKLGVRGDGFDYIVGDVRHKT